MRKAHWLLLLVAFCAVCFAAGGGYAQSSGPSPSDSPGSQAVAAVPAEPPGAEAKEDLGDVTEEQAKQTEEVHIADPLEPLNRAMYHFNDKFYFWLAKPFLRGYNYVIPESIRQVMANIYDNARAPIRIMNNALQGKFDRAGSELVRLVVNSTVGVAGMRNIATDAFGMKAYDEDLGQTFGVWGLGHGAYLVLPLLGPSSARDFVGWVGDWVPDPVTYVQPVELRYGLAVHYRANLWSFHMGEYEAIKKASVDPYVAMRSGYVQHREKAVKE